ncbi:MAG: hypothetical protein JWM58_3826 [Rhizobium sp.]|nr:hypothetical protein [Rhizobium sp.]
MYKVELRLSLGPMPYLEARRLADELAGLSLKFLRAIEQHMTDTNDTNKVGDLFGGASDEDDLLSIKFMTMLMKSAIYDIQRPDTPPTYEEARGHEMIRNLVSITKETTAEQEGQPHNQIVADNAEVLTSSYIKKWLDGSETSGQEADVTADKRPRSVSPPVIPMPEQQKHHAETVAPSLPAIRQSGAGRISIEQGTASLLDFTPDYHLDRRTVTRPASTKPLFSLVASEYLAMRVTKKTKEDRGIDIAHSRPPTDLQAFIERMKFWPAKDKHRPDHLTPDEIIESNQDFRYLPITHSTLSDGYVAAARAALIFGAARYNLAKSVAGARYTYPDTSRRKIPTEPLSSKQISSTFEHGVLSGYLDLAMVPLLALLTGRRLGLLIFLRGSDIREKFDGVWVAQTKGIVMNNGVWQRVPIKNSGSMTFYVLHNFLVEIGFVAWAKAQGDSFIFPELMRLVDPSKSASSYMGRLMAKAGAKEAKGEVFHSLRGGYR